MEKNTESNRAKTEKTELNRAKLEKLIQTEKNQAKIKKITRLCVGFESVNIT